MLSSNFTRLLLKVFFGIIILVTACNCNQPPISPTVTPSPPEADLSSAQGSKKKITSDKITSDVVLATPRDDIKGLPNFAKVSDVLYRGAQPAKEGLAELKKMGIKTIINLRSFHSDKDELKGLGLQYLNIECDAADIKEENAVIFLKVVTNSSNQPVFVHCQHGSDRTGLMVAIYRIYIQGWNKEDAIKESDNFGMHKIYKNIPEYIKNFDIEKIKLKVKTAPEPKIELIE